MAQAPGPRGSPQVPQGPNDSLAAKLSLLAPTANTDNNRSSFVLWHVGHTGCCAPNTIVSNCRSHSWHRYSKMGIDYPSLQHRSMLSLAPQNCSETFVATQVSGQVLALSETGGGSRTATSWVTWHALLVVAERISGRYDIS